MQQYWGIFAKNNPLLISGFIEPEYQFGRGPQGSSDPIFLGKSQRNFIQNKILLLFSDNKSARDIDFESSIQLWGGAGPEEAVEMIKGMEPLS